MGTFSGFTLQANFLVVYLMNVTITSVKHLLVPQNSAERCIVPGSPYTVLVYWDILLRYRTELCLPILASVILEYIVRSHMEAKDDTLWLWIKPMHLFSIQCNSTTFLCHWMCNQTAECVWGESFSPLIPLSESFFSRVNGRLEIPLAAVYCYLNLV